MKTICVDFDGVLHGYSRGWQDGSIYDPPKEGAKEAMERLVDLGYELVIYSTRCYDRFIGGQHQLNQVKAVEDYLLLHKIPFHRVHSGNEKPLCCLFIDDNAYRFQGDWPAEIIKIEAILSGVTNVRRGEVSGAFVRLEKKEDDPLCLRASIGGTHKDGYYCTYRGDRDKVVTMLQTALAALKSDQRIQN